MTNPERHRSDIPFWINRAEDPVNFLRSLQAPIEEYGNDYEEDAQ